MSKNVKGGPFLVYKHALCCKITKNSKGDPLGTLKNFRKKVEQCRKKIKINPLVSAGFVGYVKKVKNERRDPLETKNFRKKVEQCRKKIKRGDPLVSAGFVGYVKKVKNERRDPLKTKKKFRKKVEQCRKKSKGGTL